MNPDTLPAIAGQSRRHQVLSILRQAIVSGQYGPGDRLIETDIARQMGTSRAPVREALRQLEQEGLVVSYPYRGTEVVGISQEEVEQVLVPVRLVLERFAFARALPILDQADIEELTDIVEDMKAAARTGDMEQLVECDIRFHETVIVRSGWQHCLRMWRTIQPRVRAYFFRDAPRHRSLDELLDEHIELLEAVKTGDVECVLGVLDRHIRHYMGTEDSL